MSDNVSRTLIHLDLPRAINHAIGIPVTTSMTETNSATMNEFSTAFNARFTSGGWFRICCIVFHFIIIPRIGGSRIKAKKRVTATAYTVYLTLLVDESLSNASVIFKLGKPIFLFAFSSYNSFRVLSFDY
jgi:hypothetical protein